MDLNGICPLIFLQFQPPCVIQSDVVEFVCGCVFGRSFLTSGSFTCLPPKEDEDPEDTITLSREAAAFRDLKAQVAIFACFFSNFCGHCMGVLRSISGYPRLLFTQPYDIINISIYT